MKRIYILFIGFAFAIGGCTKNLKPVDYGAIKPNIFPKNERDVQAMVNACYYPLRGSWFNGINSTSERGLMMIEACQTGVLRGGFDIGLAASTMNYNPDNTGITYFYDNFHGKIGMYTLYINRIKNPDLNITDEQRASAIAEIRCARGLLAYDLFDLYGPIVIPPLSVLQNPLKEVPLPRMSHDSMVSYIESDLQSAVRGLPNPNEAKYGQFSTGLARMLLIRLYLHEKEWEKVLHQCDTMINNGYYSIDPDYVGMWDIGGAKASPEVIWAIPCDYEGTSENQWQMMALPQNYPSNVPGYGSIQSSWWFYDTFEPDDIRKTRLIASYTGTDGVDYSRSNPGLFLNYGPLPLKMNPDKDRTTEISAVDIIEYRYADVLLSKAEALANLNSGPTQEAIDLVNTIRNRAQIDSIHLSDYSGLSDFIDELLMERGHEFWCENGQYRADLIRYGKLVDRVEEVTNSQYAAKYKTVFPFSSPNIVEGKGEFIQNPGYE